VGQTLDFGNVMYVGVDPGTVSLGVCLLSGGGRVVKTWSIRAQGEPLYRLSKIHEGVIQTFAEICEMTSDHTVQLMVETWMFRAGRTTDPKIAAVMYEATAKIAEVRGMVIAEAWRCGWTVRKVAPVTWKSKLNKAERAMDKNKAYVDYWNRMLSTKCKTPDEVDAIMIALQALPRAG
jgi:Holliday junction resolvasome RuvABC endonuclease subunit